MHKNLGGYCGEGIDIGVVLADARAVAEQKGWQADVLRTDDGVELLALRRTAPAPRRRLYVSTGIHGDEPAGPLALRQLLREDRWPADVDLWLCPCLNPAGFPLNCRASASGLDLNRDYQHLQSGEVRAHVAWLEQQPPFDLTLCLHEDWEAEGFYVYELNPDHRPSLAEKIIAAAATVCPIDLAPEIEGRAARGGIIRPDLDPALRTHWPEAFYLIQRQTRLCYTLEAPSDFPLPVRVAALVAAARAAMEG